MGNGEICQETLKVDLIQNKKLHVLKGSEYIRYSHFPTIDLGYPSSIKGNWGDIPQD